MTSCCVYAVMLQMFVATASLWWLCLLLWPLLRPLCGCHAVLGTERARHDALRCAMHSAPYVAGNIEKLAAYWWCRAQHAQVSNSAQGKNSARMRTGAAGLACVAALPALCSSGSTRNMPCTSIMRAPLRCSRPAAAARLIPGVVRSETCRKVRAWDGVHVAHAPNTQAQIAD